MAILSAADAPFSDVDVMGLAIHATDIGFHSGILYLRNGEARILDLAFHHWLRDEVASPPFRWSELGLDQENKVIMAALVARIANVQPAIPYGFNSDGVGIDPDSGNLVPPPIGRGLTCATFILAVFRAFGHQILADEDWHARPEDTAWQDTILGMLAGHAAPEHVEAVREDRNAPRFRPEEVVGAGHQVQWPVSQAVAQALAIEVRADLAV